MSTAVKLTTERQLYRLLHKFKKAHNKNCTNISLPLKYNVYTLRSRRKQLAPLRSNIDMNKIITKSLFFFHQIYREQRVDHIK